MGLWATIRNALGLQPPLTVREPEPFAVTPEAAAAIEALPEGRALHVRTQPHEGGRMVVASPGPADAAGLDRWQDRLLIAGSDVDRLRGLQLHHDGERWLVRTAVELRARETPNPDGRLYLTNRPIARGRPRFVPRVLEDKPRLAELLFAHPGVRSLLFRDHTLTVVREPGTPWSDLDRHVDQALRQYWLTCGQVIDPVPPRARPESGLADRVWQVLEEEVAPAIHRDGGGIELVDVEDGIVRVNLTGACQNCPASTMTLKVGIERRLQERFPGEVMAVEQV